MRDGEIEIRIPESIPLEQGGFPPHYSAVCGLCLLQWIRICLGQNGTMLPAALSPSPKD